MIDLSKTSLISFEAGNECNLSKIHDKCPINYWTYTNTDTPLSKEVIIQSIKEAQKLNFHGYVAFHYYNEPLLKKDMIMEIIDSVNDCKFLLWSNGLLLDRKVENNKFLKKFNFICITCYFEKDRPFFEELKKWHGNVQIFDWELDDREKSYTREYNNEIGCRRPLFELPIDYFGNVHLCCFDWNATYDLGNINKTSFKEVILSEKYQKLLLDTKKRLLDQDTCPKVCKKCDKPWLRYTKYYDIG